MLSGKSELRRVKLVDMVPADYNPRKISDEAFQGLGKSMEQFGLLSRIVWNERTGNIVGGHQRYKELVQRGEEETEVRVVDLDENDEVALNVLLNSGNIRGDFTPAVKEMLERLEVNIGDLFAELRLHDLHDQIQKASRAGSGDKSPYDGEKGDGSGDDIDDDGSEAVVVCPECKSMWRLRDEEVIKNAQD